MKVRPFHFPVAWILFLGLVGLINPVTGQQGLSLDSCFSLLTRNNQEVLHSGLLERKAAWDLKTARLEALPTAVTTIKTHNSWGLFVDPVSNLLVREQNFGTSSELEFNLLLFGGFYQRNTIRLKKEEMASTAIQTEKTARDLCLELIPLYFDCLFAQEAHAHFQTVLDTIETLSRRFQSQFKKGMSTKREILNFQYQEARLQSELLALHNRLRIDWRQLNFLMGLAPSDSLHLEPYHEDLVLRNYQTPTGISTTPSIRNHPDLDYFRIEVQKRKLSEQVAASGRLPKLELYGNMGTKTSTLKEDEFDKQLNKNQNERLGIRVTYPLTSLWSNYRETGRARLEVQEAESNLKQAADLLTLELESLLDQYHQAFQEYLSRKKQADLANEEFRYSRQLYENGNVSVTELSQSFARLNEAQSEFLHTKYLALSLEKRIEILLGLKAIPKP